MQKTILVGNLSSDPEIKQTASGTTFCTFSVATRSSVERDENGDYATEYWNVCVFGKQGEVCKSNLHKGRAVYVFGSAYARHYVNKLGGHKVALNLRADTVEFIRGARFEENESLGYTPASVSQQSGTQDQFANQGFVPIMDDEQLPF